MYDFLQEAMGSVLLLHTALDNFANESLPADLTLSHEGQTVDRTQVEGFWSLPKRLTVVLPAISRLESIQSALPDVWRDLSLLKESRDDIGHVTPRRFVHGPEDNPGGSIFSRPLAADLSGLLAGVEATIEYYGKVR